MKVNVDFYKGLAIGQISLLLAVFVFLWWLHPVQNALIEQASVVSEVAIRLEGVRDLATNDEKLVKLMKNRINSCLTSQFRTLEIYLFVDSDQLNNDSIRAAREIVKKYWSIPIL